MKRAVPYMKQARAAAYSTLTDEQARERLLSSVEEDEIGLEVAIELSGRQRGDFISDRAFRLLAAVADGSTVSPIDQTLASLFGQEEELGRLPLREAFNRLATMEPDLRYLATWEMDRTVDTSHPRPYDQGTDRQSTDRQQSNHAAQQLVGVGARSEIPILRSDIAASIVRQYLEIDAGRMRGDVGKPYFDAPRQVIYSDPVPGSPKRPAGED